MAYTKIHAIKATVDRAIAYICDSEKTDQSILISSYGCSPQTAHFDFQFSLSKTDPLDENKAYHLIQSFLPGEVSFEEAHQIGMELADRVLERNYSYIISTHIDKNHIHNHIIFCAAQQNEPRKYNDCKKSYYRIRQLSDALCKEHQLSVITSKKQRGKCYKEWSANQYETSWKTQIRNDIRAVIRISQSYEEFLERIKAKGYEIKGESLEETAPKYISFRPLGKEHFVRGSARSLGAEFTKEQIQKRISEQRLARQFPCEKEYSSKRMIDTSQEKFQNNPYLKRWATIENLKIAASTYQKVNSITELEQKLIQTSQLVKETQQNLVALEHQIKKEAELLKYAEQYKATRPYQVRYKKSKKPEEYFQKHETELILYDGAKQMLYHAGIHPKSLNIEQRKLSLEQLKEEKKSLQQTYQSAKKELQQLTKERNNLNQYLEKTQNKEAKQKQKEEASL